MEDGEPFNTWISIGLCAISTVAWCVAHPASYAAPEDAGEAHLSVVDGGKHPISPSMLCQRRKLRRYFIYVILASLLGAVLFVQSLFEEDVLIGLCCHFSRLHQVAFALAIGHWSVAVLEDFCSFDLLGAGLSKDGLALFPLNLCCSPNMVMLFMYTLHHCVTVIAYIYSLCTHRLGGVMVQGLLFEIPVMFMVRRDIAVCEPEAPAWLLNPTRVALHWFWSYLALAVGRGPAEVLWVLSWMPGRQQDLFHGAEHFDVLARVLFHVFALFFTVLNMRIIGLFLSWQATDMARARAAVAQKAGESILAQNLKEESLQAAVVGLQSSPPEEEPPA